VTFAIFAIRHWPPPTQRQRPGAPAPHQPLFCDSYRRNRATGSFVLNNEAMNGTVGVGMINYLIRQHRWQMTYSGMLRWQEK
jgi:hypothetical protein